MRSLSVSTTVLPIILTDMRHIVMHAKSADNGTKCVLPLAASVCTIAKLWSYLPLVPMYFYWIIEKIPEKITSK